LEKSESDSWLIATLIMIIISSTTFIIQRFIFHVPTILVLIIYLKKKSEIRKPSP